MKQHVFGLLDEAQENRLELGGYGRFLLKDFEAGSMRFAKAGKPGSVDVGG